VNETAAIAVSQVLDHGRQWPAAIARREEPAANGVAGEARERDIPRVDGPEPVVDRREGRLCPERSRFSEGLVPEGVEVWFLGPIRAVAFEVCERQVRQHRSGCSESACREAAIRYDRSRDVHSHCNRLTHSQWGCRIIERAPSGQLSEEETE
jgi:hypothetical protein